MNALIDSDQISCGPLNYVSEKNIHECRGLYVPEPDGTYSAHCLNLPGVHSQGETLEDAIENLRDAFRESFQTYQELGMEIPWNQGEPMEKAPKSIEKWVLVNV